MPDASPPSQGENEPMPKTLTARKQPPADASLTIRFATPDDEPALDRLAQLDSSRTPRGAVMVAEVNGELWAALSLDDSHAVSDPFHSSAEALWMVAERARGLRRERRGRMQRLPRVWPARA
jgi:hypothetical protein